MAADGMPLRPPSLLMCLALLTLALSSCGTNLLVVRRDAELHTADGQVIAVQVDYRVENGLLQDDDKPVATFLVGILLEPVDMLVSTGLAIRTIFRDADSVVAGPFGWFLAMTPFATLVPAFELPPRSFVKVDGPALARLRNDDPDARTAAAREAFGDPRIRSLLFR